MTNQDATDIIKSAKRRDGFYTLCTSASGKALGTIFIKIKRFKRVGLLIDIGLPFDLTEELKEKVMKYIDYVHGDILTKGFKEAIGVGKSYIVCPVYQGDEYDVVPVLLDILGFKVQDKSI